MLKIILNVFGWAMALLCIGELASVTNILAKNTTRAHKTGLVKLSRWNERLLK